MSFSISSRFAATVNFLPKRTPLLKSSLSIVSIISLTASIPINPDFDFGSTILNKTFSFDFSSRAVMSVPLVHSSLFSKLKFFMDMNNSASS